MASMNHRKMIRHFHQPGHLQEFTFSCDQRSQTLAEPVAHNLIRHVSQ